MKDHCWQSTSQVALHVPEQLTLVLHIAHDIKGQCMHVHCLTAMAVHVELFLLSSMHAGFGRHVKREEAPEASTSHAISVLTADVGKLIGVC